MTTTPTAYIGQAVADLRWLTTVPHTIDHCVKLRAQQIAAERTRWAYGTSPTKMAEDITDSAWGTGQHADPTGDGFGRRHDDDAHETMASIRHAADLVRSSAIDAHHHAARLLEVEPRAPHPSHGLMATLNEAEVMLIVLRDRIIPNDPDDPDVRSSAITVLADNPHMMWLLRSAVGETASWLRATCEAAFDAASGPERDAVPGRKPDECSLCGSWRKGTVAVSRGRCEQCTAFQDHHKCKPTEAIVRRWEATGTSSTPPGMILEAKAQGRKRARSAG